MPGPLPPMKPTDAMIRKRIKAGARTWQEIDPALAAWQKANDRFLIFSIITIGIGVLGFLTMVILIWANK